MRLGCISETCSNNEDDITFTYMFKKCNLECRCVITGSVSPVLFHFMFIGDFILHTEMYSRGLRYMCFCQQPFPNFCQTLRFHENLIEYSVSKQRNVFMSSYCKCLKFLPRHKNFIFCSFHPAMPFNSVLHPVGQTALWIDACQLNTNNLNDTYSDTCCVTVYSELWLG
jgi:hypothetical protein